MSYKVPCLKKQPGGWRKGESTSYILLRFPAPPLSPWIVCQGCFSVISPAKIPSYARSAGEKIISSRNDLIKYTAFMISGSLTFTIAACRPAPAR